MNRIPRPGPMKAKPDVASPQVSAAKPAPKFGSIEVHINELVLHGFPAADRRPIADAIERELSGLLTHEGLPAADSFDTEFHNGGTFRAGRESAGANVARAIYGGLRR